MAILTKEVQNVDYKIKLKCKVIDDENDIVCEDYGVVVIREITRETSDFDFPPLINKMYSLTGLLSSNADHNGQLKYSTAHYMISAFKELICDPEVISAISDVLDMEGSFDITEESVMINILSKYGYNGYRTSREEIPVSLFVFTCDYGDITELTELDVYYIFEVAYNVLNVKNGMTFETVETLDLSLNYNDMKYRNMNFNNKKYTNIDFFDVLKIAKAVEPCELITFGNKFDEYEK